MAPEEYTRAFEKAMADLEDRMQRRDLLNAEIAGLRETVRVLSVRADLSVVQQRRTAQVLAMLNYATPNLTDSIRSLLTKIWPKEMTAIEVRNALGESGFAFDDFSSPLAACHTVLKRMLTDGEVEPGAERDGKPTYKRVPQLPPLTFSGRFSTLSGLAGAPTVEEQKKRWEDVAKQSTKLPRKKNPL